LAILRISEHGELVLDISGDGPDVAERVKDVLFYFDHRDSGDGHEFIIGGANRVIEIVPFLDDLSRRSGIRLEVENRLRQVYESFRSEKEIIDSILQGRRTPLLGPVSHFPARDLLPHQERAIQRLLPLPNNADF